MTRVAVLVVDGVELLDVAGPVQVFHEAAQAGADYRVELVSFAPNAVSHQAAMFSGLAPIPHDLGPNDIVIVPGSSAFRELATWRSGERRTALQWVRESYERGATVASVCVGAFLLGNAGLLDGRTSTTHWKRVDELARAFPRANVVANRLYTFDGRVASSAGIAAGVDLALAIVDRRNGPRIAAQVAREMVLSVRRPASHEQISPFFEQRDHLSHEVHVVQDWLVEHPGRAVSLDALAARAGVSTRTLTRQFKAATGSTVKQYSTKLRLEHARSLLADHSLTIEEIAARCGFADGRQLRRLWKETHGAPPSAARP